MEKRLQKSYLGRGRFVVSSLSNLFDNLDGGTCKIKWKHGYDNRNYERCGIKYKDCTQTLKVI